MVDIVVKCLDIVFYPLTSTSEFVVIPFLMMFVSFLFILFFRMVGVRR